MKTKRLMVACLVTLFSTVAVLAKELRVVVFKVEQMECANCEKKVKNTIKFEAGLKNINTDLKNQTVTIEYDADKASVEKLQAAFKKKLKYEAVMVSDQKQK